MESMDVLRQRSSHMSIFVLCFVVVGRVPFQIPGDQQRSQLVQNSCRVSFIAPHQQAPWKGWKEINQSQTKHLSMSVNESLSLYIYVCMYVCIEDLAPRSIHYNCASFGSWEAVVVCEVLLRGLETFCSSGTSSGVCGEQLLAIFFNYTLFIARPNNACYNHFTRLDPAIWSYLIDIWSYLVNIWSYLVNMQSTYGWDQEKVPVVAPQTELHKQTK
jgi:hypothetical protein